MVAWYDPILRTNLACPPVLLLVPVSLYGSTNVSLIGYISCVALAASQSASTIEAEPRLAAFRCMLVRRGVNAAPIGPGAPC